MNETDALLEEWRKTRACDLADKIEALTPEPAKLLIDLWKGKSQDEGKAAFQRLKSEPDDPRMTVMFVRCFHAARWPGSGAKGLWTDILGRLVTLRDARAIAPLRSALEDMPHFMGVGHTRWMILETRKAVDALEKDCRESGVSIPTVVSPYFVREAPVGARASKLAESVWANPEDDETKLVVADALMEQGDPWGEFITLGFKIADGSATEQMKERHATLLHKHAALFGGPIAHIATKDHWRFEKGFLVAFAADRSQVPRRRWEDASSTPYWSTVREVTVKSEAPMWWLTEIMKNPALANLRLLVAAHGGLRFERAERGGRWHVTRVRKETTSYLASYGVLPALTAMLKGLRPEERASVVFDEAMDDETRASFENVRASIDRPPAPKATKKKKKASAAST